MKDLAERQRETREQMKREARRKNDDSSAAATPRQQRTADNESTDISHLKKRIAILEAENARL